MESKTVNEEWHAHNSATYDHLSLQHFSHGPASFYPKIQGHLQKLAFRSRISNSQQLTTVTMLRMLKAGRKRVAEERLYYSPPAMRGYNLQQQHKLKSKSKSSSLPERRRVGSGLYD
ncbi:hypothetical protein Fot_24798 [Forsythia ovata]|uniref:Uncharacterized protein n=1 Tax=Forsythia ovata TaxID=205694 RepID=A0ABD1U777_9LAMI